jgi:YD repeat-containing protein
MLFGGAISFGQRPDCLLSKKTILKKNKLTYEQTNLYNLNQQVIEKKEFFLEENPVKYTQTERYVYDNRGNITELTMLLNGMFEKTVFRKFNVNNQLLEEAIVSKDGSKANLIKSINGNETKNFNPDGTFTNTVKEITIDGKTTKEIAYDIKGNQSSVTEFAYDPQGKLTQQSRTEALRNRTTKTVFKRDENGVVLEEVVTINTEPFSRNVYEINDTGKIVKTKAFNRYEQLDYELVYTYNVNGDIASESYFYNNELITKKESKYDENGNLIQQNNFERGKLVSSVKWEYICS